jgi:hypothetical protein
VLHERHLTSFIAYRVMIVAWFLSFYNKLLLCFAIFLLYWGGVVLELPCVEVPWPP